MGQRRVVASGWIRPGPARPWFHSWRRIIRDHAGQGILSSGSNVISFVCESAAYSGCPLPKDKDLKDAIAKTLTANGLTEAAVRLSISRGVPKRRGLLPEPEPNPSMVIHAEPFTGYPAELYERGARAVISGIRRNEHSPLARVKSLNYLDNVLARHEAETRAADDALLLNTAGDLACASAANLFLLLDGTLVTPSVTSGALPGTVRELRHCRIGPASRTRGGREEGKAQELRAADEVFPHERVAGNPTLNRG